jgi:hypothetical protein
MPMRNGEIREHGRDMKAVSVIWHGAQIVHTSHLAVLILILSFGQSMKLVSC